MGGERAERIEAAVDWTAAALFGAAAAFVGLELAISLGAAPWAPAFAGGSSGFALAAILLRHIRGGDAHFSTVWFDLRPVPEPEPDELLLTEMTELVLTEADRVEPEGEAIGGELVLDDILAEIGPDSRVVRLFDVAAMPTPAQLKSRIDRHLQGGTSHSPSPDASEALHEALAELRRSLG
jgi:hypothetical protein